MSDPERQPPTAESGGRFYLALGALAAAALVGAYLLIGTPGLHQPVAKAPADVAQQPAPPAGPTPR